MVYRDEEAAQRCRSDELERELLRLEARLAEMGTLTTERARVIDELTRVRQDLAQRADRCAPVRLDDLRIASPCKERWADMVGDDRVRVCNGCDRPVFDLSEMTLEQAEAVLATRGITPCVRFYRRPDGTVMTADCPTGARRTRRKLAVVAGTMAAAGAAASLWAGTGPAERLPDPEPVVDLEIALPPAPAPTPPTTRVVPIGDGYTMGIPPLQDRSNVPPPPSRKTRPITVLESDASRIAGNREIEAPKRVQAQMRRADSHRVVGTVKLCVNARGRVTRASVAKSTGYDAYDDKLVSEMRDWRYEPLVRDGAATPFCTFVTLVYVLK